MNIDIKEVAKEIMYCEHVIEGSSDKKAVQKAKEKIELLIENVCSINPVLMLEIDEYITSQGDLAV